MKQFIGAIGAWSLIVTSAMAQSISVPQPSIIGTAAIGQIPGTATNDNAASGNVGEYITSTVLVGSAISVLNNTPTNIASISISGGDWNVCGSLAENPAGTTVISQTLAWISVSSATIPVAPNGGAEVIDSHALGAGSGNVFTIGCAGISVASTTTVYLSTQQSFAVSTNSSYGFIGARRVR